MKHILLVDDDARHRMRLRGLLEAEGYRCEEAQDGQEALEKLASGSFALVITDYLMPSASGFDLLRAMGKDNRLETTLENTRKNKSTAKPSATYDH